VPPGIQQQDPTAGIQQQDPTAGIQQQDPTAGIQQQDPTANQAHSGATWDTAAGPNSQPGTVAHPDVGGWDDDDGFFGQSATIALNAPNSNVLVHVGRFATAEHSPGAPTYHCIR